MVVNNKKISIPQETIRDFCRRWQVVEFALSGSVLWDAFQQDSDVDVLVTCSPKAHHSLLDLARMEEEFGVLF
jgi:predicted nucleotidyltransferase